MDNFSEADANQGTASAVPVSGQTSDKTSVSTLIAGMGLRLGHGKEKGSVETATVDKLSSASGQTGVVIAKPAVVVEKTNLDQNRGEKDGLRAGN